VHKPGVADSDIARWRSAVAGVLAKSTRRDPSDLPAEPERLLDSPTYEGFPIRPLYTSLDALPEPAMPGQWPYVRGGDALRDVKSGWRVAEAFPANGSADANGAVLVALTEGVSALVPRPDSTACSTGSSSTWCLSCSTRAPTMQPHPTRCWHC
jgi:methylmalonyl-CoA mutase